MRIFYLPEANMLSVALNDEEVEETVELEPGLYADLDSKGNVIGIESHDAKAFLVRAQAPEGLILPSVVALDTQLRTDY